MVQMTTHHSSICPPPLPPSPVPLLLSALPTTRSLSFFILLFPFAPTLILLLPPPPASDADSPSLLLHQRLPMDFPPALNLLTEFGCGFVLLRSLSRIFNLLGLFLILTFCFKFLCFGWNSKNALRFLCDSDGVPRIRFCLDKVEKVSKAKTKPLKKPRHPTSRSSFQTSGSGERGNAVSDNGSEGKGENEREGGNEDEVFDVMKLRRIVRMERQKANAAFADLEKERTAASSSAEEAMAMIPRLQSEKSAAEIQATQFRRMAEQKLDYDNEVIESLQWTITQHEFQKCEVEDRIEMCREELRQFMRDEEIDRIEDEVSRSFMYENENDNDNDDPDGNSVGSSSETESRT